MMGILTSQLVKDGSVSESEFEVVYRWSDTGSKYKKLSWTREQFIYNMVAWKNQFRFWGCSRALSKVMAYVPEEILKLVLSVLRVNIKGWRIK